MRRHRFYSMCPYFAMFPEAFAENWIERLTQPGHIILDPFSGRGTTALSAVLKGREVIACDTNAVAYCLTRAKVSAPQAKSVAVRLSSLEKQFEPSTWHDVVQREPNFFAHAYHPRTLAQLLFLKDKLRWKTSEVDNFIAALVLGALHGDLGARTPYLSNQMPRTISTKPAYSVRYWQDRGLKAMFKDTFPLLRDRAAYRYQSPVPRGRSRLFLGDMRTLPVKIKSKDLAHCVITSPPYLDVTSFEEDQWLRLWFLGGPALPKRTSTSDDRHTNENTYWCFIADMWRSIGQVVREGGHVVIRIGSRSETSEAMKKRLLASSVVSGRQVRLRSSTVTEIQRRQTDAFRPGTIGCKIELDCHFQFST